jgi:tripeptidyl-peptidase-1
MALGARGISVINGSGDGGVRGVQSNADQCMNNTFAPVFPGVCPFVTAVGGTMNIAPEVAANLSSGGFSNYFARPAYQNAAVGGYLEAIPKDFQGVFNRSGRGFPDVCSKSTGYHAKSHR